MPLTPVKVSTKTSSGLTPGNLAQSAFGFVWTAAGAGASPAGSTIRLGQSKLTLQQLGRDCNLNGVSCDVIL
eukprot:279391-Ditylum_brightwellii.AAC.1